MVASPGPLFRKVARQMSILQANHVTWISFLHPMCARLTLRFTILFEGVPQAPPRWLWAIRSRLCNQTFTHHTSASHWENTWLCHGMDCCKLSHLEKWWSPKTTTKQSQSLWKIKDITGFGSVVTVPLNSLPLQTLRESEGKEWKGTGSSKHRGMGLDLHYLLPHSGMHAWVILLGHVIPLR